MLRQHVCGWRQLAVYHGAFTTTLPILMHRIQPTNTKKEIIHILRATQQSWPFLDPWPRGADPASTRSPKTSTGMRWLTRSLPLPNQVFGEGRIWWWYILAWLPIHRLFPTMPRHTSPTPSPLLTISDILVDIHFTAQTYSQLCSPPSDGAFSHPYTTHFAIHISESIT